MLRRWFPLTQEMLGPPSSDDSDDMRSAGRGIDEQVAKREVAEGIASTGPAALSLERRNPE